MSSSTSLTHLLIGTAGHIDHGKTRLIGRLTNIDTDRLPEEKSRGISIDLGFAHWESDGFQFGVVDVPGHEKFVKNMVAGATGIDFALLVVAADDGVMPQTREHVEIMDLLGIKSGVIAITKCDLVPADFVELVQSEVEDLIAGTFLEGCAIIPVSSETGSGIDTLQEEIVHVATSIAQRHKGNLFRMPIDRVFTIAGHGTIVTGSVQGGSVAPGDTLELLPTGRKVRVRSVENHGVDSIDAHGGQRTAINLAGVKLDEVARGDELAGVGFLQPARRIVVDLRVLESSPITIKDRANFTLHIGTNEQRARVNLKGVALQPGQRAFAELRTLSPVTAAFGQRFILRRVSPPMTVAGGMVVDPGLPPGKRIKDLQEYGRKLSHDDPLERISAMLSQVDPDQIGPSTALSRTGIPTAKYADLMDQLKQRGDLQQVGTSDRSLLIHRDRLEALSRSVLRCIREEFDKHQPRRSLPRNTLLTACRGVASGVLLEAVFVHLSQNKQLVEVGSNLGLADMQVKLSKAQRAQRSEILQQIIQGNLAPPNAKELAKTVNAKQNEVEILLRLCEEEELLIRVADDLYYAPEAIEQAQSICLQLLQETSQATMGELRDAWGVTRKYAVPLCEYFDRCQVTVRDGDLRRVGPGVVDTV